MMRTHLDAAESRRANKVLYSFSARWSCLFDSKRMTPDLVHWILEAMNVMSSGVLDERNTAYTRAQVSTSPLSERPRSTKIAMLARST